MLWTHEAQPSESTKNFDHCDDAHRRRQEHRPRQTTFRLVFYHNINVKENVFSERELKKALRDTLTQIETGKVANQIAR